MKNSILLKFFSIVLLVFILLSSFCTGQDITPSPTAIPSSGETVKEDGKMIIVIIAAIIFIIIAAAFFVAIRIRTRLREAEVNNHKRPITGLASKNAGLINPGDSSKE